MRFLDLASCKNSFSALHTIVVIRGTKIYAYFGDFICSSSQNRKAASAVCIIWNEPDTAILLRMLLSLAGEIK